MGDVQSIFEHILNSFANESLPLVVEDGHSEELGQKEGENEFRASNIRTMFVSAENGQTLMESKQIRNLSPPSEKLWILLMVLGCEVLRIGQIGLGMGCDMGSNGFKNKMESFELHINLLMMFSIVSSILSTGDGQTTNFNVLDYGAKGDGKTDDSQAFLKAWEGLCTEAVEAPPALIIPSDYSFLLQPLLFSGPCKSNTVHIQLMGNVVAPDNLDAWINCSTLYKWLAIHYVDGLIFNGFGHINGQGSPWWDNGNVERKNCSKPTALYFHSCNGLQLRGITHLNSPRNHITLNGCNNVTLSNLTIIAPDDSPNTDGINLKDSTNVTIQDTTIATGDDCIAINEGTFNVNITGVACGPGHGISIGSLGNTEDYETVEEIHVRNCSFNGTQNGARIKTRQDGIGHAKKISFEHIIFIAAGNPIIIDQNYFGAEGGCKNKFQVSDITYRDIQGSSAVEEAIKLDCCGIGCPNIVMDHVNLTSSLPNQKVLAVCNNASGTSSSTLPDVPCLSN
ncbi:probable polygalacturonase At3g15720 [Ziziphus jujuba]|uniref:Probable polygalacturonase At3g15720 n=1 Tax=Ziziphus jujuba TaxID=326968 RepID=A0ABM3ISZ3_ZIZJJ|nr:probable polygalacturonase At3g15720 [Ziziphus jujuba]